MSLVDACLVERWDIYLADLRQMQAAARRAAEHQRAAPPVDADEARTIRVIPYYDAAGRPLPRHRPHPSTLRRFVLDCDR